MPKVILTNDGIKETVIRPAVLEVTQQLQSWTGLKEMTVLFNGDTEVAVQPGSTIDDEPGFNNTPSRPLWRVVARDEHQTDSLLATAVHQMEYPEFFIDKKLGIKMRPVYSPTTLTLDFEYRAPDAVSARRWRDEVRAKVSLGRVALQHQITYSYLVPDSYFKLLAHLHELREAKSGYGEDYDAWLRACFIPTATIVTDLAGNSARWAVREQQVRIAGHFEFSEIPDDFNKNGDDSSYVQTFSYKLHFDCPIATAADYPYMVHNQLIDQAFWTIVEKDDFKKFLPRSSHSHAALSAFDVHLKARPAVQAGMRFPEFHEFIPRIKNRSTVQVFSAMIGLADPDPVDPLVFRTLMNFSEIDTDYELRPEFIRHLKWEHTWICTFGESMVNVCVYRDGDMLDQTEYYVDKDLNLILKNDPDMRSEYYVTLSLLTDPTLLSEAAKQRQRENAEGITLIGAALCPNLVANKLLPPTLGDNYISRAENDKFLKRISQCTTSGTRAIGANQSFTNCATVMILFLEATKKGE